MLDAAHDPKPVRVRLSPAQQKWVVQQLAAFEAPADILKALKEAGVEISRQALSYYDPTTVAGQELTDELKADFHAARAAVLADAEAVPITHQAFRQRELYRLYLKNRDKAPVIAADLLEQAAKETGGMFTNRRELTGKDGGPIEHQLDLSALSEEELEIFARLLVKANPDAAGDTE